MYTCTEKKEQPDSSTRRGVLIMFSDLVVTSVDVVVNVGVVCSVV